MSNETGSSDKMTSAAQVYCFIFIIRRTVMEEITQQFREEQQGLDFVLLEEPGHVLKKTGELSRRIIDLVFIISYLIMLSGMVVAVIGDIYYNHSNKIIVIGTVIFVLGAIIFSIIYKIDDEPRCFGGIDA